MLKIIDHHSASSGNTFMDCPQMWIIEKLYGFKTEENARMKMGHAAEEATHVCIKNQISDEESITNEAKGKYIERCTNLGSTEDKEYEWSGKIANAFVKELKEYGNLISYQKEADVPGDKYGLKFNIVAKTDFEFEEYIVDTKATARIFRYKLARKKDEPLEMYIERQKAEKGKINYNYHPKPDHLRQQFLYREIFGKECLLLYGSPMSQPHNLQWDNHISDLGDGTINYLEQLINAFKSIEHILNIANTKEDVVRIFPLTFSNWRWSYASGAEEFARKIWSKAFK